MPLLEGVLIEQVAAEGKSLAHHPELGVVFVRGAIPGDRVNIQIVKKRNGYAEGRLLTIVEPAPDRVEPPCKHFGHCGGCQWQMLPYHLQLHAKQEQVKAQFERIGHVECPAISPIIGADPIYGYRNKMEYSFSPRGWLEDMPLHEGEEVNRTPALGFHAPGSFSTVVNVEYCHLQGDMPNSLRNFIGRYAREHAIPYYDTVTRTGILRSLVMRVNTRGELMLLVVVSRNDEPKVLEGLLEAILREYPSIHSLQWGVNGKANDSLFDVVFTPYGSTASTLTEQLEDLSFLISPNSFFQTNSHQALRLYSEVQRLLAVGADDVLYDLYCGTGTIGLFIGRKARRIVGIEEVEAAVDDARLNAERNAIPQAHFFPGDVLKILTPEFIAREGVPTALVTDPPRAGMHPKVVEFLLQLRVPRLVYVSCNPATQARDLALLNAEYSVAAIQPVDMFPHTKHVESIALLTLR